RHQCAERILLWIAVVRQIESLDGTQRDRQSGRFPKGLLVIAKYPRPLQLRDQDSALPGVDRGVGHGGGGHAAAMRGANVRARAKSRRNSARKSGCAIEINASPRSRSDFPWRFTAPYSVITQCTWPRVVTTPAPSLSWTTRREI